MTKSRLGRMPRPVSRSSSSLHPRGTLLETAQFALSLRLTRVVGCHAGAGRPFASARSSCASTAASETTPPARSSSECPVRSATSAPARTTTLGEAVAVQLDRWALTPAEQEVALLPIKGLRHKEVAQVRGDQ